MNRLVFAWDKRKETANIKKYDISFEAARTIFYDENAVQFFDPDHSTGENRFILLGVSHKLNALVVCHCFREEETLVRIISARKADKDETNIYWSYRK
ncbi:MAG: BrnT family toxin [Proteobacteria bacterium]|nr:BrnT family toxin [Pseudomonadota bacterium]